jgi:hypothetical protein
VHAVDIRIFSSYKQRNMDQYKIKTGGRIYV